MDTIFSIIDKLAHTPEAKMTASRSDYQKEMIKYFQELPVPHKKVKIWSKVLKISPQGTDYKLAAKPVSERLNSRHQIITGKVLISPDKNKVGLNEDLSKQGVILCSLEDALEQHLDILQSILKEDSGSRQDKLAAFTAGFGQHGFLFYIPKGVRIDQPVEIRIENTNSEVVLPVLAVTKLEENAAASMILETRNESSKSSKSIVLFNHAISVDNGADLRVVEMQLTGKKDWNINHENVHLEKEANLSVLIIEKGGEVNKRTFSAALLGEGGRAAVTGIYEPAEGQHYIYDTYQNHMASHTTSDLLFNGVLRDDAYSLWKGNVYIAEGTRGADGFQVNNNLLLNENVHAVSIPGLEIITDEVRCTHAVTLKTVDADQLFYLKSRGIELKTAQEMIIDGFLEEAAMRIKDEKLLAIAKEELK